MPTNPDPYRNYKFRLEMDGFIRLGFSKVSGLSMEFEDAEYREGDEPEFMSHFPGPAIYEDLTLERGFSADVDFITKMHLIFAVTNGTSQGGDNYRFNGSIYLRNKAGDDIYQWKTEGNWGKRVEMDDLDASGTEILLSRLIVRPQTVEFIQL